MQDKQEIVLLYGGLLDAAAGNGATCDRWNKSYNKDMGNEMEKLNIIKSIYWDYDINPEFYLWIADHPGQADPAELKRFFIRAFENVRWHELMSIFGISTIRKMMTTETRSNMRKEARQKFDIAYSILHRQPVPVTRQDTENRKLALKPFLSDRWYSAQQRISES